MAVTSKQPNLVYANFANEIVFIMPKNYALGQIISVGRSSLEAHILRDTCSRGGLSLEADILRGE